MFTRENCGFHSLGEKHNCISSVFRENADWWVRDKEKLPSFHTCHFIKWLFENRKYFRGFMIKTKFRNTLKFKVFIQELSIFCFSNRCNLLKNEWGSMCLASDKMFYSCELCDLELFSIDFIFKENVFIFTVHCH